MNNVRALIFFIIISMILGYFSPNILHMIGLNVIQNFSYAMGFTILLPLNTYIRIQPLLDDTNLTIGLKKREVTRLNEIIETKRSQAKYVMIFLLILTITPILLGMMLSSINNFLFKILIGASISNITYVFYGIGINEEISRFKKQLFLKQETQKRIKQIQDETTKK